MGIISINEKRTSTLPTNTTGKEVSYRVGDQFAENLQDPTLTFKLGMYSTSNSYMGGFGVFWEEESTGNRYALDMVSSSFTTTDYQGNRLQTYITSNWTSVTCDLTGRSNGRAVFFAHKATDFRSDIQIDDVILNTMNGTAVDLDPSQLYSTMNSQWERSTYAESMGSNSTARAQYAASNTQDSFENIATGVTVGKWNWHRNDTGSADTGLDNAADNNDLTYYLYFEASAGTGVVNNRGTYLRWKNYYNIITGATI